MPFFTGHPTIALALLLAAVAVVILAVGRLGRVVPRGSPLEAWVQRWSAVGQALVAVVGLLYAIQVVYGGDTILWRWLTLGVLIAGLWASRRALSDWANGLVLRSEGTLRAGGRIGVGLGRGRIRRLGLRSAELEAEDGRVLRLPYTALAESAVEISPEEVAARSHTFEVEVAGSADAAELSGKMATEALLCPWSSAQPAPSVRVLDRSERGLRFEVTVYPIDPSFVSRVEGAVRAGVEARPSG